MATWYPTLGNPQTLIPINGKTFTLEELQTAVGGSVQLIHFSPTQVLFVHEEGQMLHLPINEKITELIGQDLLPARLGVTHLVGNVLLCTYEEAGLSVAKNTRAQQTIALRSWCLEQIPNLKDRPCRDERTDWQTIGRYWTLEDIASQLSAITSVTPPSQIQTEVENLLDTLAEKKAYWLRVGIKKCHPDLLLTWEWTAEGAVAQIDDLVPELWNLLSPQWRCSDKKHGQYYHIYHAVDHEAMLDIQVGIHRWASAQRAQFYREVALLKVERQSPLNEVLRLTSHTERGWQYNREVLWFQDDMPLRETCKGDIVVSLMSGATWIVDDVGFQLLR